MLGQKIFPCLRMRGKEFEIGELNIEAFGTSKPEDQLRRMVLKNLAGYGLDYRKFSESAESVLEEWVKRELHYVLKNPPIGVEIVEMKAKLSFYIAPNCVPERADDFVREHIAWFGTYGEREFTAQSIRCGKITLHEKKGHFNKQHQDSEYCWCGPESVLNFIGQRIWVHKDVH